VTLAAVLGDPLSQQGARRGRDVNRSGESLWVKSFMIPGDDRLHTSADVKAFRVDTFIDDRAL
jgi:hypothetical protein